MALLIRLLWAAVLVLPVFGARGDGSFYGSICGARSAVTLRRLRWESRD